MTAGRTNDFHGGEHTQQHNFKKKDEYVPPHFQIELHLCPECGSERTWKDGNRYTNRGKIQRYICRSCSRRFSEHLASKLKVNGNVLSKHLDMSYSGSDVFKADIHEGDFPRSNPAYELLLEMGKDVGSQKGSSIGQMLNILSDSSSSVECASRKESRKTWPK